MDRKDLPPEREEEARYRDRIGLYGGFSLAKIVLSNALPSSLYYPNPNGDMEGGT